MPRLPRLAEDLALAHQVEGAHRQRGAHEERHVDEHHLVPAHVVADDHGREHQQREQDHQRVGEVRGEVEGRLHLDGQGQRRGQDLRQQLLAGLDRALGPAVLLALEGVHLHRDLGRRDHVLQEHEPPALHLRAVGEVEVLGERVVLPAAAVDDRLAAPDARGAVEVEEAAGAVAPAVLEDEVAVEEDRLHLGEQRVVAVDVAPAHLHHAHLRIARTGRCVFSRMSGGATKSASKIRMNSPLATFRPASSAPAL